MGQQVQLKIGNPDPGKLKLSPKKEKIKKFHVWRVLCWNGSVSWKLNVLCRDLRRHLWPFFDQKFYLSLGLDPDSATACQQQPGSGSGFSEMYESGLSESGPKHTLVNLTHFGIYFGRALLTQVLLLTIDGDGVDGWAGQEVTTRDTAHLRLTPTQEPLYN
jgi:hypothetical protein